MARARIADEKNNHKINIQDSSSDDEIELSHSPIPTSKFNIL